MPSPLGDRQKTLGACTTRLLGAVGRISTYCAGRLSSGPPASLPGEGSVSRNDVEQGGADRAITWRRQWLSSRRPLGARVAAVDAVRRRQEWK